MEITAEHSILVLSELLAEPVPKIGEVPWENYLAKEHPDFWGILCTLWGTVLGPKNQPLQDLDQEMRRREVHMLRIVMSEIIGPVYFAGLGSIFSQISVVELVEALGEVDEEETQESIKEQTVAFMTAVSSAWGEGVTDALTDHQFTPMSKVLILGLAKVIVNKITDSASRA